MDTVTPGVVVLPQDDHRFPARLLHLSDPPERLYLRGDLRVVTRPGVAIVGSRRCTTYGRRVAHALAAEAARCGWTVWSGLALGVDAAAHRGALSVEGATGAVLGSGVDRPSPRSNAPLAKEMLAEGAQGLVLSEFEPGEAARPYHFPKRNRLLAALADRVVVVEAAQRSGALITARVAADLGREVWAVPGSVFSSVSQGTHALLDDGAIPVVSLEAWRHSLGLPDVVSSGAMQPQLPLGPAGEGRARTLWELMKDEGRTPQELAELAGCPVPEALVILTELELGGWVERAPGPTFHRRVA